MQIFFKAKVFLAFLLIVSCSVLCANAQESSTPSVEKEHVEKIVQLETYPSLLWKISGNELKAPSYLFGTMHSQDKRVHAVGDLIMTQLEECEAVALELDMDDMNPMSMMKGMYMKDTLLQDLINEEEYKKVKSFAKEKLGFMGVFFNINKIKPMFTASLLGEIDSNKDMSQALDMRLHKEGKKMGKTVVGIETIDEQMGAIDALPLVEQAKMLLTLVEDGGGSEDNSMEQMVKLYATMNLDSLTKFYEDQKSDLPGNFEEALLVKRNKNMAHRTDSLFHLNTTFVAVGALHLPGKDGVIELLRERGYDLEPIDLVKLKAIEAEEKK